MPYRYLDHQADIGLEAWGATLDAALTDGVQGLLALQVDIDTVTPREIIPVEAEAGDPGALFVALLNAVLAEQDIQGYFFHDFRVTEVQQTDDAVTVRGELRGEPIDHAQHQINTEVKAATWGGFRASESAEGWTFRCVLDL